jgi:hypothetical protein
MRISTAVTWPPMDAENAVGAKCLVKAEAL